MIGLNNKYAVVPLCFPADKTATWTSDIISLKNYNQAEIYLLFGAAVTATVVVTLSQGVSVSSCATVLPFRRYYQTGFMLNYDGASTQVPAVAGESVTGAGTGYGLVYEDRGGIIVGYGWTGHSPFVDNEVLTFSGGKTAVADGVRYNEDIMIPVDLTAGVNTFSVVLVHDINKIFMIPINSAMLTQGFDCISVTCTDSATPTITAAWAILSEQRHSGTPMPTAIYN